MKRSSSHTAPLTLLPYMYTVGNPVMLVDPDGRDNKKQERFGIGKRIENWFKGDTIKQMFNDKPYNPRLKRYIQLWESQYPYNPEYFKLK